MSELKALEDWAGALLAKIEPKERRKINLTIARELRKSQQKRIKAQRNPDGSAFAARKKPKQHKAVKPLSFIYNGKKRVVTGYYNHGKLFTGYDQSSSKVKTFNRDKVEAWLPTPSAASTGSARSKKGRIKQKAMFMGLARANRMKLTSTANAVGIGFMARNAKIARIHQYGLSGRPGKNSPEVQYDKRELLGFTDEDMAMIRERIIDHLGNL